ncbi:MAG: Mth938-like domain-containing protein [Steroidobacteraceae bacterium]
MKFTLEGGSNVNVIRSYSAEEIRIGEHIIRSSCVVTADALIANFPPATLDDLAVNHLEPIFELRPELVLLGTGARQRFAPAAIRASFAEKRIGLEAMDLGAACRTFNILVQEERRAAAVLFLK